MKVLRSVRSTGGNLGRRRQFTGDGNVSFAISDINIIISRKADVLGGNEAICSIDSTIPPIVIEPFKYSDDVTFFEGELFRRSSRVVKQCFRISWLEV